MPPPLHEDIRWEAEKVEDDKEHEDEEAEGEPERNEEEDDEVDTPRRKENDEGFCLGGEHEDCLRSRKDDGFFFPLLAFC